MSLINQMLKDLDARHEADARGRLHREIRPLPGKKESKALRLLVVGVLALTIGAAAWWGFAHYVAITADHVLPPAEVAAPAPSQLPVALPPPAIAAAVPEAVTAPSPAGENVSREALNSLKLSAMLDKVPPSESTVPPKAVAANAAPQKRPVPVAPASAVSAPSGADPKKTATPGGVDKMPVAKTLRERSEADYRRAVALVNGARIAEATDLLLDVLRQDGGHVASRQLLARLLIEQRRNDEAMAILAEGLSTQPGQVPWAMTLARLQVDRGDLAGAARTLQQSQPFAAGNADYQGFAGHVQHRLGHEKESVDFYQAAVRLAPGDGRWWLGLGLALEADHRAGEAREAFLRARASGALNADLAAIVDQKLR